MESQTVIICSHPKDCHRAREICCPLSFSRFFFHMRFGTMKLLAVCYVLVCLLVFTHAGGVKQPEKACIGCLQQVESSHPDIQRYSIIAVNKYKQQGELPGNARLIRVLDAKRQTVAGTKYEFVLEFVYKLPRNVGQYSALCKVEVYKKLGNQPADITIHPCKKTRASVPDIKTF